jgi:hypothetical protein
MYLSDFGAHKWFTAASGTAGNAITFTQAMTLTTGGNLLVGSTTAPTGFARLSLVGGEPAGTGANSGVQFTYNGSTFGGGSITTVNAAGGGMSFYTFTGNVGSESYSERMRITSAGNVGIGSSLSATTLLQLNTASVAADLFTATNSTLTLVIGLNNSQGSYVFEQSANALRFGTTNAERARITSGGDLLVGTASALGSSARVEILATSSSPALFARAAGDITNQQGQALVLSDATVSALRANFIMQRIGSRGGLGIGVTEVGVTNDRDLYLGYTGGIVAVGGGTTVNTSGGAIQLTNGSYGGITFPATQVASSNVNTLDDYEEGSWTPSFGGITSASYSNQLGTYIKIGRMVYLFWDMTLSSFSGTFDNNLNGFPFQVSGSQAGFSVLLVRDSSAFTTATAGGQLKGFAQQSANYGVFQVDNSGVNGFGTAGNPTLSANRCTGCVMYQASN